MAASTTYSSAKNAKEFLDMIGETVHHKVHAAALQPSNGKLKGHLSQAKFEDAPKDKQTENDPCKLKYGYHTTVTSGYDNENPCKDRPEVRFSYTEGAQCHSKKIRGSNGKNEGACAPFRRLHLCDHNLENISDFDHINNHTLLTDVCEAAKFEAESLEKYRAQYQEKYGDVGSPICTVLARSFADIGDIIRGKDLYLGNKKEKEKLENNLKTIFKKIYDNLKNTDVQKHYSDDDEGNYYKLRNAWWEANRQEVWKAITCGAAGGKYFRNTCAGGRSPTPNKCRCIAGEVPTYFDYVPQYLRWFEEWAEDFCRKKNKKIKDVKRNCREEDKYGNERYCDRNGFDCERTIYKKGYFVIDKDCNTCSVSCRPYESWIDNQKKEFEKQKKKCENEISGNSRKKRSPSNKNYEGYEKKFYDILNGPDVGGLDKFLELLNKEEVCKKITTQEEGKIDFKSVKSSSTSGDGDGSNKTFYRSKYCEECPLCGVEKGNNGNEWKDKDKSGKCDGGKRYNIPKDTQHNVIPVLSFGDERDQIKSKIDTFCKTQNGNSGKPSSSGSGDCGGNIDSSLCEPWKCYKEDDIEKHVQHVLEYDKEVKGAGGLCILQNKKEKKTDNDPEEFQKTFNDFFYFWVGRLLNDSIEWREKLGKCLEKKNGNRCRNGCNTKCECFLKWVNRKRTEWDKIKKHFKTQDFGDGALLGAFSPYYVIETVLELEYFPIIQEAYGDARAIQGIKNMLEEKKQERNADTSKDKTIIDYLLDHEKKDAEKCKQKQEECEKKKQKQATSGLARSETHGPQTPRDQEDEDEEDDDDDEHSEEGGDDQEETENPEQGEVDEPQAAVDEEVVEEAPQVPSATTTQDGVKPPCEIVDDLFKETEDFKVEACKQKYALPQRHWGWKCISDTTTTKPGESGEPKGRHRRDTSAVTTTTSSSGATCIPPRRRKLYVGKLHDWANTVTQPQGEASSTSEGKTATQPQGQTPSQGSPSATSSRAQSHPLLTAFVESAAVETFFLWHRYKKEWELQKNKAQNGLLGEAEGVQPLNGTLGDDPQTQLQQTGVIPPPFLRQMFYTLGDYRDICVGNVPSGIDKVSASGNTKGESDMQKIKTAIDEHINSLKQADSVPKPQPPVQQQQNSSLTRETLWETFAPQIWKGMIYALTYNTDSGTKDQPPTQIKDADKLLDKLKKENGKEGEYHYENVKLENSETSSAMSTGPRTTQIASPSGGDPKPNTDDITTPTLTQFVVRPTYFRYLEEWGETFCRQRTRMLEQLDKECRGVNSSGNPKYCSGDGNICDETRAQSQNTFISLHCSDCLKECMKYKKWIDIKFEEFQKQKSKFDRELQKLKANHNGDNKEFCDQIEKKNTAADFLKALRHCKDDEVHEEKDNDNKIDFSEPLKTFSPTTYCKACPVYGVNCNGNKRGKSATNGCKPKGEPQNAANTVDGEQTLIEILIDDGSNHSATDGATNGTTDGIDEELRNCSEKYNFFKRLRKQEWTCQKKKDGIDQCNLTKPVAKTDDDKNIWFNEFFQRWLRYFVQDYNKLKDKINPCIKNENEKENGKEDKCINGCNIKCECVGKWLEIKGNEWGNIKKHYNINSNDDKETIAYRIKSYFVEQLHFDKDHKKAQDVVEDKDQKKRDELWGCTGNITCETEEKKIKYGDFIANLIKKLKEKIESCPSQPDETTHPNCDETLPHSDEEENFEDTPTTDDSQSPAFCKDIQPPEEPKEDSDRLCDDKKELKCNDLKIDMNTTYKPKIKLIGLGAHYYKGGVDYPNVYVPPRVRQLCLQPLKELAESNEDTRYKNKLIEALKKCAYNEGKGLYEYYNNNKDILGLNASQLLENEIETYILQAMQRSYADYGSIVKGDILWDYEDKEKIDLKIIDFAKNHKSTTTSSVSTSDDVKRRKLWESIRAHVWKAMICGYENVGGSFDNEDLKCKLPDTENTYQFFRWFVEWGENFCIRRKQELSLLKSKCPHDICSNQDEHIKKECKNACEKYEQFLINARTQYKNQVIEYDKLKYFYNYTRKKGAVEFLKDRCNTKCICFQEKSGNYNNKAFAYPPDEVKYQCNCESSPDNPFNVLNDCPSDNTKNSYCKNYNLENLCEKSHSNNFYNWKIVRVKNKKNRNEIILVPPRRRHLCRIPFMGKWYYKNKKGEENLKSHIYTAAYSEGYRLSKLYKKKPENVLEVMKNSFADYGNIIKGDDMLGTDIHKKLNVLLDKSKNPKTPEAWWETNKKHIWYAMLCGYQKGSDTEKLDESWCSIPTEDGTDQFLRWVVEWAKEACKEKKIRENSLGKKCNCANQDEKSGLPLLKDSTCINELEKYLKFNILVKESLEQLNIQYSINKTCLISEKTVEEYIKSQLKKDNCDLSDIQNNYESPTNLKNDIYKKILKNHCPHINFETESTKKDDFAPVQPPSSHNTSDILTTTIPVGIALALGSIAFLFMKKKTQAPVDLFSVINIPKSDYDIPTLKSSNRYIPYVSDRYKGKTYIYIEGDSDEDKYAFMSDTTDVTSSESEYEELDINDIYVPRAPKYKTLIEVVLEPSGNNTTASGKNTTASGKNTPSDNTPTPQPITDNEWNTLKHEFISQYLQSEQPNDVPNDYSSGDIPTNTNITTTSRHNVEEKPFITSIHDRDLYSGEEYSYNVNMSTNSMDDIPINRDNNVYSGIDLINDTLSGEPINIYDEVLKRKENELFGTNHVKQTSIHSVAKLTNSDPIHNQLELFHKWLDRHRDMCEKWENHHERLAKLKEEWENETHSGNTHPSDSNKTLNTDVSIQIHMDNPKPINEFTNMDTILEDLDKPFNEPYYYDMYDDDIYYDVNDDNDISTRNIL
ncbi:hypothetical protein C923_03186 [Plasmodium falciparum UGT5.1]|uniref:Duffy-binding-like domain-containing protein n=1 Tax=Plasmodium falciparum UGT5.1 TaxID=1237627 RepID=W7JML8_PLAFA|nr:hypothetical protein C923_03186 [Plasmodium falciparum UGT5.1]